jgi:hypothetical protein
MPFQRLGGEVQIVNWRIGIATRAERRTAFGKTTVDLFLDTLATFRTT